MKSRIRAEILVINGFTRRTNFMESVGPLRSWRLCGDLVLDRLLGSHSELPSVLPWALPVLPCR